MSTALIRQALEFVDPEENVGKRNKRRQKPSRQGAAGQGRVNPYRSVKKAPQLQVANKDKSEENIKKLLALSTPTVDHNIADKIIERAIKGKPLADKVEEPKDDGKSILFPDEDIDDFEKELFCS